MMEQGREYEENGAIRQNSSKQCYQVLQNINCLCRCMYIFNILIDTLSVVRLYKVREILQKKSSRNC
jgi:hypothetical protein